MGADLALAKRRDRHVIEVQRATVRAQEHTRNVGEQDPPGGRRLNSQARAVLDDQRCIQHNCAIGLTGDPVRVGDRTCDLSERREALRTY